MSVHSFIPPFLSSVSKGTLSKTGSKQTVDTNPKSESSLFIVQESGISRKSFRLQSLSRAWKLSVRWLMSSETWPQCRFSSQSDMVEITISSRRGLILLAPSAFRRQQQQATLWLYAASEWLEKNSVAASFFAAAKHLLKISAGFQCPAEIAEEKQITVRSLQPKSKCSPQVIRIFHLCWHPFSSFYFPPHFFLHAPKIKGVWSFSWWEAGERGPREARSSLDVYEIIGAGRDVFAAIIICSLASALREA